MINILELYLTYEIFLYFIFIYLKKKKKKKKKDLLWYDKSAEVDSEANISNELEEIKQKEAEG